VPSIQIGPERFRLNGMTEHDLTEVVAIEEDSGLSRWGWEAYHAELSNNPGALMFVVRREGGEDGFGNSESVAGFIASRKVSEELHINNVAVRHRYRRRGVASMLLITALRSGKSIGAKKALLEVRAGNFTAQMLYTKHGFHTVARRRSYYTSPVEDALIMTAQL
jgi:ribosomal-protein-alanine N-acetyltransferase